MHHVIGRTRRQNDYKEYWVEDGESGYSDETWILDEWLLISEDATYFTLVEDEEGYTIVKPVIPKYPSFPQGEKMQDFHSGNKKRVLEYGETEILYYEGESTYLVRTGDKSAFSDYSGGRSTTYSAEWRYKNGEVKEIEFFEEVPITRSELLKAFNIEQSQETYEAAPDKTVRKGISNKFIIFWASVFNFVLAIVIMLSTDIKPTRERYDINITNSGSQNVSSKLVNDTIQEFVYKQKVPLKDNTKKVSFDYYHSLMKGSKSMDEVILSDVNNDTIFYKKEYGYNLSTDKKEALSSIKIGRVFKRDLKLKDIYLTVKMQIHKDDKKSSISHHALFEQSDKLYDDIDVGMENMMLSFYLFILFVIWPKKW